MMTKKTLAFTSTLLFVYFMNTTTIASESKNLKSTQSLNTQYSNALQKQLANALKAKDENYQPRTEHKALDGSPVFTNRLLLESSPYLLQHAHNPINWFSWSEEALSKARIENKPIFLSIGYSTCHWCHVMEKESFENLEIAAFLNKHFISIKVDREQHPDVDSTYMTAAALLSGHTGWPLTGFITSQGAPFYAASYIPPEQFLSLLQQINDEWNNNPKAIDEESRYALAQIQRIKAAKNTSVTIQANSIARRTATQWLAQYDDFSGGFSAAPKFPNEPVLFLLLDQALRQQDEAMLNAVLHSLDSMQQGGIYDQVGGGFHRYATDPDWLLPHFEKILYNQAQLARVYLYAWQITGNPLYKRTTEQTLDYVLRELRHPSGPFYSATDADSDGGEGRYFLWNTEQLREALPDKEQFDLAFTLFGLNEGSNFDGSNILYLPQSLPDFAINQQLNTFVFFEQLEHVQKQLLKQRMKRTKPHLDDKIITAWNGMLIRSLAEAGDLLEKPEYTQAASTAASWLWKHHISKETLIRSSREGHSGPEGTLEDYAHLAHAYLTLYDTNEDLLWLQRSKQITNVLLSKFWSEEEAQLYLSPKSSLLPFRIKSSQDSATISATAITYELLTQLSNRDSLPLYQTISQQIFASEAAAIQQHPMQYSYLLAMHNQATEGSLKHRQFAAQGALKAELISSKEGLKLVIDLAPGWHINAHSIKNKRLIPTSLSADWIAKAVYPEGSPLAVAFMQQPISVYSRRLQFDIQPVSEQGKLKAPLHFRFQACSSHQCLAPESLYFSPMH
jgi:uncharacterized protein YyaL (SSP411 family)